MPSLGTTKSIRARSLGKQPSICVASRNLQATSGLRKHTKATEPAAECEGSRAEPPDDNQRLLRAGTQKRASRQPSKRVSKRRRWPTLPEPIEEKVGAEMASALAGTTCMELALEGERLCKAGDFANGIRFFEEAIKVGTNDDRTLSAIYSQLGNAYFYLEDYAKALDYHKLDVSLVRTIGDEIAEAKACGNLGNTLKMLDKFDEAAIHCRRYQEISRKLGDHVGEARALYNLGNVYHTKGKRMIGANEQDPGELSDDIRHCLEQAIKYYEQNLELVAELNDFAAMGRAYGNVGNTHYLLGNFERAVENHTQRLELARRTKDKSAERRAHLNLGNANVFLGQFQEAVENYAATLKLAQELQDKYTEAHSCYSLANTYTFLRDYQSAIKYHLLYLEMIKDLDDKLGEGRACWSLVNIYQMVNDPESALVYAKKHYAIAEQLGDKVGQDSAKLNIDELNEIIEQKQAAHQATSSAGLCHQHSNSPNSPTASSRYSTKNLNADCVYKYRLTPDKRQDQEQRRFKKQLNNNTDVDALARKGQSGGLRRSGSNEKLFDMIAHFQSGRIDDQRCEMLRRHTPSLTTPKTRITDEKENLDSKPESQSNSILANSFNTVASTVKATYRKASLAYPSNSSAHYLTQRRPTCVPSAEHRDQLFDLIAGVQCQRMDEQRASLPAISLANGVLKNPITGNHVRQQGQQESIASKAQPKHQQSEQQQSLFNRPGRSDRISSMGNALIHSIPEDRLPPSREKSHSIAPHSFLSSIRNHTSKSRQEDVRRVVKTESDSNVRDENFLDSLMKYQSTRFNDQRSEFPEKSAGGKTKTHGEKDEFLNLIVKFQSDRIDDQRSAPPKRQNLVHQSSHQ